MKYPDLTDVRRLHQEIIQKQGSLQGELNISLLESTLAHIQNDDYYPFFEDKLTHLVFCCIQFHPFIDANKRTALLLGALFIKINLKNINLKKWFLEMEDIAVDIADNKINKEKLKIIIQNLSDE